MDNKRTRPLSEIEKEDLAKYQGSYRMSDQPSPQQMISDEFNAPYNATEDIPKEFRRGTVDQSYDAYANENPVYGNFLKLKRMLGRTMYGGQEK